MPDDPLNLGTWTKLVRFLLELRKRDLLLLGFIGLLGIAFGALTGYIPSPITTIERQSTETLETLKGPDAPLTQLIELNKLQLYLARENCLHGAQSESEKSRCDRQSIREAISSIDTLTIAETYHPLQH